MDETLLQLKAWPAAHKRYTRCSTVFGKKHGLQCGFCTPGILMSLVPFLEENPNPTEKEIRDLLSGNICRCTGYQKIVEAVQLGAKLIQEKSA